MDYFRASNNIFKRIRFRLIFSSGAIVDMHNANWSFSIIFQHSSKTLEDKDVNPIIDEIIHIAEKDFNAKLRL